jgi:hypothetical protein
MRQKKTHTFQRRNRNKKRSWSLCIDQWGTEYERKSVRVCEREREFNITIKYKKKEKVVNNIENRACYLLSRTQSRLLPNIGQKGKQYTCFALCSTATFLMCSLCMLTTQT